MNEGTRDKQQCRHGKIGVLELPEPTRLQHELIELIHRHTGLITFHRVSSKGFDDVFTIRATELSEYKEELAEYLRLNSYFSLNGFREPKPYESNFVPDLLRPLRKKQNIAYLTSCFTDIDFHDDSCDLAESIQGACDDVRRMQAVGEIPPPSIVVESGRGIWLLWLLRGKTRRRSRRQPKACSVMRRSKEQFSGDCLSWEPTL